MALFFESALLLNSWEFTKKKIGFLKTFSPGIFAREIGIGIVIN